MFQIWSLYKKIEVPVRFYWGRYTTNFFFLCIFLSQMSKCIGYYFLITIKNELILLTNSISELWTIN